MSLRGVRPGAPGPEFELPRVGGGTLSLAAIRDRPTLLHLRIRSPDRWPSARWSRSSDSMPSGDQVPAVDVVVRQAHQGPTEPPYASVEQKMADAQRSEQIPWPALVDDVEGTVHRAYTEGWPTPPTSSAPKALLLGHKMLLEIDSRVVPGRAEGDERVDERKQDWRWGNQRPAVRQIGQR